MFKRVTLAAAVFACNCSGDDTLLEDVASQIDELRNCSEVHGNDYLNVINAYLNGPGRSEWTSADCKLMAPIWTGDDDKGQLFSPLWRGPGGGIDDWVPAPPSDLQEQVLPGDLQEQVRPIVLPEACGR